MAVDWQSANFHVFMSAAASAHEIDPVADLLGRTSEVEKFEYMDQHATYVEFLRRFEGPSSALSVLSPTNTPSVFNCQVVNGADVVALPNRMRRLPGVSITSVDLWLRVADDVKRSLG